MESALAWIGKIFEWIGQFIPRWVIVPTTHGAVKFVRGSRVVSLGPGFHFYWPLLTTLETYPIARQALDLREQTMVTSDDRVVALGGMVVYEIKDIQAIIAHTYDPDDTIHEISLSAFHEVCCQLSWDELKNQSRAGTLDRKLRRVLREQLKPYGVFVIKATITDLAPCRVLKVIQSQSRDGAWT